MAFHSQNLSLIAMSTLKRIDSDVSEVLSILEENRNCVRNCEHRCPFVSKQNINHLRNANTLSANDALFESKVQLFEIIVNFAHT